MFYLIAVPLAFLWFHSMYSLMKKYKGNEPFWLKIYLTLGAIYFVAIPTLAIKDTASFFNLSNGVIAALMGITGTIMLLILINKTPKY